MIDHNMGFVFEPWLQTIKLKTLVEAIARFKPVRHVTVQDIQAAVQPADAETIAKLNLDLTARYYTIHTKTPIATGQFFEYGAADFRIVRLLSWGDYGYYEAVGQDTKEPLLVVTPEEPEGGGE